MNICGAIGSLDMVIQREKELPDVLNVIPYRANLLVHKLRIFYVHLSTKSLRHQHKNSAKPYTNPEALKLIQRCHTKNKPPNSQNQDVN